MATSGTTTFDLDANEIMEEAFERAGVDKQKLNADHARSARRSMNLILQDWANENIRPWAMEEATITTVAGVAETLLSADTIDVIDVTLKRDNYEIPMTRLSRSDYQALPEKSIQGRPDRYFLHKDRVQPKLFIYQTPENSTDTVEFWRIRRLHDVTAAVQNVDVPARWLEPFIRELAYRLYEKRPAEEQDENKLNRLERRAMDGFNTAREEDRDRAPLQIVPDMTTYSS